MRLCMLLFAAALVLVCVGPASAGPPCAETQACGGSSSFEYHRRSCGIWPLEFFKEKSIHTDTGYRSEVTGDPLFRYRSTVWSGPGYEVREKQLYLLRVLPLPPARTTSQHVRIETDGCRSGQ